MLNACFAPEKEAASVDSIEFLVFLVPPLPIVVHR